MLFTKFIFSEKKFDKKILNFVGMKFNRMHIYIPILKPTMIKLEVA